MKGTIKFITENEQYRFNGEILGEDGRTYRFNSWNWIDKNNITLDDIKEGDLVEFEQKAPNSEGYIFPKQIHFPGDKFPIRHKQAHGHGDFRTFVRVKTDKIVIILKQLAMDFPSSEEADDSILAKILFNRLASTFDRLQDDDFSFSDGEENPTVSFPSGFTSSDGQQILLYCTKNTKKQIPPWYSESISINGKRYGHSILNDVNANWYDIRDAINAITSLGNKDIHEIIRIIENRCYDIASSIVLLKKGQECSWDDADELYIPTSFQEGTGKEIYLLFSRRRGARGYGWYLNAATYENAPLSIFEKKAWFEKWAGYLENDMFEKLADQTLEEQWSFGSRTDYGILKNYLRYTFSYQFTNGNIGYSPDERYAAFNTGLPDRNTYEYLYAFFERTEADPSESLHPLYYRQNYRFKEFVRSGRGGSGKLLSGNIRPLPNPPQYFVARSATVWELDFNDSNQVTSPECDDAHILIQRCERIPLEFYRRHAAQSSRLTQILDSSEPLAEKHRAIREYFKPIITDKPDNEVTNVYNALYAALQTVIVTAVKKLSWNWRAVVPCYNPERNEPCYLLPVSFVDQAKPDRAMIASVDKIDENYIYTIHTVIPLDWAYLDARLVCRPESEWLAAGFIEENDY